MTKEDEVFIALKKIMAELLELDVSEIDEIATMDSRLREDVGIDSVESLDFLTAIESTFSVQVLDEEAINLKHVSDVIKLVLNKK